MARVMKNYKNKKVTTDDVLEAIDPPKFYFKDRLRETINVFFSKEELVSYISKVKLEYSKEDGVFKVKNKNEL